MSRNDAALDARLRRMRLVATGLLLAMAALFVATSLLRESWPWLGIVRAFSEAAVIGGLADWFAVTALFRHPLGLPIPHTAIVRRRKDEIGVALAEFISRHFLVREVIESRLRSVNLAERLGEWMSQPENARSLARDVGIAAGWLIRGAESGRLGAAIRPGLRSLVDGIPPHRLLAVVIEVLATGNHAQSLIDRLVEYGRDQLSANRLAIRMRIREQSPWWMPKFVDEEIYDRLVAELERILDEIGDDPDHEARALLNQRLRSLTTELRNDPALLAKGIALRQEILDHPEVNLFLNELWERTRDYLGAALEDGGSDIRQGIEEELRLLGGTIAGSSELGDRISGWLAETIVYVVEHYREPISRTISATIAEWDANATADRIELHIGSDLQFIRINGTLVGGCVGVLLYLIWGAIVG